MAAEQTLICTSINNSLNCIPAQTVPHGIFDSLPFIPLLGGAVGPSFYIFYQNRPRILDKYETANYINAESGIRHHEYVFELSLGIKRIEGLYVLFFGKIKSIDILSTTTPEFYYETRDTDEKFVPDECLKKHSSGNKQELYFTNIKKLREENIEIIHLITKDEEKSNFVSRINEEFFPDRDNPTKIRIRNENKLNVRNYVCTLTVEQTRNLLLKKIDPSRHIRWNNDDVEDCLIEKDQLKIVIKEIPKFQSGIKGSITINLE